MEVTSHFLLLFLLHYSYGLDYGLDWYSNLTDLVNNFCPPYGELEYATIEILDNTVNDDISQQTIHIQCNPGYYLEGPPKISCIDGTWEQTVTPHCVATCYSPNFVTNGDFEIDIPKNRDGTYKKGALATYSCRKGYTLSPPESKYRVCEKGFWTGANASCILSENIVGCKLPENISNGYFVPEKPLLDGDYGIGQRLHYACRAGFILIGAKVQQCLEDGLWSPKIRPTCRLPENTDDYPCPATPSVPHSVTTVIQGFHTTESALPGTEVEIRCSFLYRNSHAPCQATRLRCTGGKWLGGPLPNCVVTRECLPPPKVAHGTPFDLNPEPVRSRYPVNSQISYQCLPGFELQGNYILTCMSGGCWSPKIPPVCKLSSHYFLEVNGGGPMLISIATGAGVLLLLLVICVALMCRRRKPLSRAVPLPPPVPRPDLADHAALLHHPDRLALIAFADGIQVGQSVLPTYEEAVRDRGPGFITNRLPRPHWPSLAHRRNRNSPDVVHVARHGSFASHSTSRSGGDPMGSTDTVVVSEGSTAITLDTASSHSGSQTASCRAHCGSLASFDTSSVHNTEGVPLLEESELEEIQGDTHSLALENRSMADDVSFKFNRNSPDLV